MGRCGHNIGPVRQAESITEVQPINKGYAEHPENISRSENRVADN
jgi:hypothetical protein